MRRSVVFWGLTMVVCGVWTAAARGEILAQYTFAEGMENPNTQGWTWNNEGNVISSAGNFLIQELGSGGGDTGNFLFSQNKPIDFTKPWKLTGTHRWAGNGRPSLGMVLFADDGTNFWHMSFYNAAVPFDGIYMGDQETTGLTLIYQDTPGPGGEFDSFQPWSLVDSDGAGGQLPHIELNGAPVAQLGDVFSLPSKLPAGTFGWGSFNDLESGFCQTTAWVFEGTLGNPAHPGDFDGDGDVDGADFVAWQTNFPKATGATLAEGDADGDGDVDGADFVVWQTNFPFTPGSGTSPVPEPMSIIPMLIGVTLGACRCLRRRS